MFFIHYLEHVLTVHPTFFGSHVKEHLTQKLLEDVEGICTGDYYIVCVMDTYNISEGRVVPGSGYAEYIIMYRAIVWKPFKGETVCHDVFNPAILILIALFGSGRCDRNFR